MWDGVMPFLGGRWRVVRYDMLGHGRSADPTGDRSLRDFTDQFIGVLDALDIGAAHVVGLSMGAMIVKQLLVDYPDRLRTAIISNAVHNRTEAQRAGVRSRLAEVERDGMAAMIDAALTRWFPEPWTAAHPTEIAAIRSVLESNDAAAYVKAYGLFANQPETALDLLAAVDTPTLVVTGEDDVGSTPTMAQEMATLIPTASLRILTGDRHLPPIQSPDRYAEMVATFLETSP